MITVWLALGLHRGSHNLVQSGRLTLKWVWWGRWHDLSAGCVYLRVCAQDTHSLCPGIALLAWNAWVGMGVGGSPGVRGGLESLPRVNDDLSINPDHSEHPWNYCPADSFDLRAGLGPRCGLSAPSCCFVHHAPQAPAQHRNCISFEKPDLYVVHLSAPGTDRTSISKPAYGWPSAFWLPDPSPNDQNGMKWQQGRSMFYWVICSYLLLSVYLFHQRPKGLH